MALTCKTFRKHPDRYCLAVDLPESEALRASAAAIDAALAKGEEPDAAAVAEVAKQTAYLTALGFALDDGSPCFEWALEPPEGVSRGDYEASILREAKLLIESAQARAASADAKGIKVAAEGTDLGAL